MLGKESASSVWGAKNFLGGERFGFKNAPNLRVGGGAGDSSEWVNFLFLVPVPFLRGTELSRNVFWGVVQRGHEGTSDRN